MDKSTLVSALAALGVPVAPNEFVAGMLLSIVVYWVGREMFQKMGDINTVLGLVGALALALTVAMLHDTYLVDSAVQLKMMAASFFAYPILLGLQRVGKMIPDMIASFANGKTSDKEPKP